MSRAQMTLSAADATGGAFAAVRGKLDALGRQAQVVSAAFAGVSSTIAVVLGGVTLGVFVKDLVNGVDALNDLKDATGASIGNLSALEDIAARTGTSFQTVGGALVKFNAALSGAKPGTEAAEVFKRLGLSVAELKTLDPAEAFRQTAVALARFADDGNKARAVQELFGKSLREVAPLLNDVAKAGELVAKVTDEQAEQAEKFNQQLDALAKNSKDASRALVSDFLPAINRVLGAYTKLSERGGFFKFVGLTVGADKVSDDLAIVVQEMEKLQAYMDKQQSPSPALAARMKQLQKEADELTKKALAASQALKGFAGVDEEAALGANYSNEGRNAKSKTTIGDITSQPASEADKYLQKLREMLLSSRELGVEERARLDVNLGLLKVSDKASKAQIMAFAAAIDSDRALQASAKAFAALMEEGAKAAEAMRTEEEKNADQVARVDVLLAAVTNAIAVEQSGALAVGAASWSTWSRVSTAALQKALEEVDKLGPAIAKSLPEIRQVSEQTEMLAKDLNQALGDSILSAFENGAKGIGDIWKNLIKRMAAHALQAQLSKLLFGEGYGTTSNSMGGVFGYIGGLLSGGGGARANGGPVYAGRPYLVGERGPEIVVPSQAGTVLPNGTGLQVAAPAPTFVINVQGDATPQTARLIESALARYDRQRRMLEGR